MKKIFSYLILLLLVVSCNNENPIENNPYLGKWKLIYNDFEGWNNANAYKEITNDSMYFIMCDENDYYYGETKIDSTWNGFGDGLLFKGDTIFIEYKDTVDNKLRIITQKWLKVNSVDIKIDDFYLGFYNSFKNYIEYEAIDYEKLGDGTLFSKITINNDSTISISELQNDVKYFIDKNLKMLPIKEIEKFSNWERTYLKIYTYENFDIKLRMETHIDYANLKDKYTFNDKDELTVKIWLNRK